MKVIDKICKTCHFLGENENTLGGIELKKIISIILCFLIGVISFAEIKLPPNKESHNKATSGIIKDFGLQGIAISTDSFRCDTLLEATSYLKIDISSLHFNNVNVFNQDFGHFVFACKLEEIGNPNIWLWEFLVYNGNRIEEYSYEP